MLICGFDCETTGLDPAVDRIIEVGAVLWDTELAIPIALENFYVRPENLEEIWKEETSAIHGISLHDVKGFGYEPAVAWPMLDSFVDSSEYIVAHNGNNFDKLFVEAEGARQAWSWELPWLDTTCDIEYPESITTRKLMHLAAEHGFLNPFSHRAVFDVLTMLKVLSCYDINEVIAYSKIPVVKLRAMVSFDEKELAKERGYRWEPSTKVWWKSVKEHKVEAEQAACSFKTVVCGGE